MNDTMRWAVSVGGGVLAIAIALASSLASPIFVFDKVVVGALLVGGFASVGVSVQIGTSPAARAQKLAETQAKQAREQVRAPETGKPVDKPGATF